MFLIYIVYHKFACISIRYKPLRWQHNGVWGKTVEMTLVNYAWLYWLIIWGFKPYRLYFGHITAHLKGLLQSFVKIGMVLNHLIKRMSIAWFVVVFHSYPIRWKKNHITPQYYLKHLIDKTTIESSIILLKRSTKVQRHIKLVKFRCNTPVPGSCILLF